MINITKSRGKNANNKILSRRKRYLVFPEGSSLSVSMYINVVPTPSSILS